MQKTTLALLLSLVGLAALVLILTLQQPIHLTSPENLSSLLPNQKVLVSGTVVAERFFSQSKELLLDNGLRLFCRCVTAPPAKGKHITARGTVQEYKKNKTIEIRNYEHAP